MTWPKITRIPLSESEGVPCFVKDETYVQAFGLQWLEWSKTQLDSHTGLPITRNRLLRTLGPLWTEIKNKQVLEAGCGAGRFTELLLEARGEVTAFDLSAAVLANQKNHGGNPHFRVLRASIADIPFAEEQFDFVICVGVIQHTPNSRQTILALWQQVKPGGWLVFDHYRHNVSTWTRTAWIFRLVFRKLKPELGMRATNWLVDKLLPLHKIASRFRLLEIMLNRISPITSHFSGYPNMSEGDQLAWAQLNTHDNLTDYYKHHITVKKTKKIISSIGGENASYNIMPYTVEVRCQKGEIFS